MSSKTKHKHRRHHSSDSKGTQFGRNFLAFFLFAVIVLLSMCACTNVMFLNSNEIADIFTNESYVNGLRDDVLQYSYDMCDEASIPYDSVENELTYENVYSIATSYAYGNLCNDELYTNTTYITKLDAFTEDLSASTMDMLGKYKLSDGVSEESVKQFSSSISKYLQNKTEFVYFSQLKTATNLGKTIAFVACIVLAVIAVILGLIVFSIGNKKYRGLRAVAYSFIASAEFQLCMVLALEILKLSKTLVIYPTYLCASVMSFVGKCELSVVISAIVSFVLAMIATTFVWRIKKQDK